MPPTTATEPAPSAKSRQISTPAIEIDVRLPITPESRSAAMASAPTQVITVIQYVDGVTQVVRRVPLGGLENIASMKRSATGSIAEPSLPGGGTGVSGTLVNRLGMRPRVLRRGEFVRNRCHNVTGTGPDHADHHEPIDRPVHHEPLHIAGGLDRTAVDLDDDVARTEAC